MIYEKLGPGVLFGVNVKFGPLKVLVINSLIKYEDSKRVCLN